MAGINVEAGLNPNVESHIKKQGVIAVILRPSEKDDDTYGFYLVEHYGYQLDEEGTTKTVRPGLGLMSETFKPGEDSDDIKTVLTRGVLEEMCGYDPDLMDDEVFKEHMQRWRQGLDAALRPIGSFVHDFNYQNPEVYLTEPNTRGYVHVFVDDASMMYIGPIGQAEAAATIQIGKRVLTDPTLEFRDGYNTKLLLGSPELQDILEAHSITIEE